MNATQHYQSDNLKDIALEYGNYDDTWFRCFFDNESKVSRRFDRVYSDLLIKNFTVTGFKNESDHMPIRIEIDTDFNLNTTS